MMFGFVKNEAGNVIPANRIFDTLLYDHYLSRDEMQAPDLYKASLRDKNEFIVDGYSALILTGISRSESGR